MIKPYHLILTFLFSISLANPFIEFDKSFLFDNKSTKSNSEKLNKDTQECINYIKKMDASNRIDPNLKFLQDNFNYTLNICQCIFEEFSVEEINNLKKFITDISVSAIKESWNEAEIQSQWKEINTNINCLNYIESDINYKYTDDDLYSMLSYILASDFEIAEEIENSISKKLAEEVQKENKPKAKEKPKVDKNSFDAKVKDYTKIEGLFTFYFKQDKNSVLMEIKPEQLEKIYLASFTRQSGDANWFDGSSMMGEFPIMFKKIGDRIQAIEVNVKFRADDNLAINKAVESHISNSIMASTKIISNPNEETGSLLIDAANLFLTDVGGLTQIKGAGFKFDKSNSYYNYIKSFPENSEIDVSIHYLSMNPKYKFTLADSRSMIHKYHISLSSIPESNYKPRIVDDRVGHFMTMYQDYSDTYSESPYVRYINRWDLKKKHPELSMSEPVEPIVFWIENTVPHEFRDAVKEGILKWNLAFEKIGFKNAVAAKQMPDDADWDPADTRYNTIRWMIQPGSAYAVGPSRANPFTGELYDADIRIGSDYLRFYYTDFMEFIDPIQVMAYEDSIMHNHHHDHNHDDCHYQDLMKHKMTYAWNYLTATNQIANSKTEMKQFVHDGIVDLILHEVGHTLGLRHNFKASSIYSIDELSNPEFTEQYGVTGSVMDYNATNLLDGGHNYFQTIPGPYDYWAIEYAYAEQEPYSRETEKEFLEKIVSKSTEPMLIYGTDEDAGSRGIDPYTNRRDMTSDPIKHYIKRIDIGNEFIADLLDNFEKDGERYPKIRSVFFQGFYEYYGGARNIAKFIGGIKHSRHHIGQEYSDYPLEIIDVSIQKEALDFYIDYIFDKDAFQYSSDLLNKMAPERLGDFEGTLWEMNRLDFPIHSIVKNIQNTSLYNLFNPRIHNRIVDNKAKLEEGKAFELDYLFNQITESVWHEIKTGQNVNSFRRQLQTLHLEYLKRVYNNEKNNFPNDSESLSRLHLGTIHKNIELNINNKLLDDYTLAHLLKSLDTINQILDFE